MKADRILIANATYARYLERETSGTLRVLETFEHPESRSKVSEIVSDKMGREASDRGYGGTAYQPPTDPKRKEHLHFAHELADYLEQEAGAGRFQELAIFASNPFLGELKAALGDAARRRLSSTHDLDLTSYGLAELEQRVKQALSSPER
ncbi:host attachment protein [Extensimonas perlucida]|uniref:host attachment protein n=1 Tax=Extensimonas perlucida TaxID=2590786 RepID=UPI0011A05A49|nr:host attachment protein [Extensimonas perlucida]